MTTAQDRTNRGNVFSAQNLSEIMSLSLGSTKIRDAWDAVALISHVAMLIIGFRIVGLGEDHKLGSYATADNEVSAYTIQKVHQRVTKRSPCQANGTRRPPQITPFATPIHSHRCNIC